MDKINNPHDHFFRRTGSDPRVAGDFLANYPPENIAKHLDLDQLEIQTGSFVDKDPQEHYSESLVYLRKINIIFHNKVSWSY
ncbi:MAG: Rpn family recombination-promoting nuclease/putative transposase [Desulfonatronovibrionaceae bacterium]